MLATLSVSIVISFTYSRENPFVFHKVTASIVKRHEIQNRRNLFCEVVWKNMRNLYTRLASRVFRMYFMAFLRVICSRLYKIPLKLHQSIC